MTCVGCGASLAPSDDIVRCAECGGFQVMSATNEHTHVCTRCGNTFACWCSSPDDLGDQRMCNQCGAIIHRIRDAPRSYSTKLRFPGAQRRWRR
jgi:predicted RNA-binding Zn-ribbon protein involved in translation (DUF1610 family)